MVQYGVSGECCVWQLCTEQQHHAAAVGKFESGGLVRVRLLARLCCKPCRRDIGAQLVPWGSLPSPGAWRPWWRCRGSARKHPRSRSSGISGGCGTEINRSTWFILFVTCFNKWLKKVPPHMDKHIHAFVIPDRLWLVVLSCNHTRAVYLFKQCGRIFCL